MAESKTMTLSMATIKVVLLVLLAFSIVAIFTWAYVSVFFVRDLLGINIIGDVGTVTEVDDEKREPRPFIEVNYFTNANGSGYALQEMRFNFFIGFDMTNPIYQHSAGMQYFGGIFESSWTDRWQRRDTITFGMRTATRHQVQAPNDFIEPRLFYYDINDDLSWATMNSNIAVGTRFNRNLAMDIPIGGNPSQIRLENIRQRNGNFALGSGYRFFYYKSWCQLFQSVMYSTRNFVSVDGTYQRFGTFTRFFDVSNFFTVRQLRSDGQVVADTANRLYSYIQVRATVHQNGIRSHRQSMFGMVQSMNNFDLSANDYDTNYGSHQTQIRITEANMERRLSQLHGGYFLSLSANTRRHLGTMREFDLTVEIDIGRMQNARGLDFGALRVIRVRTLRIRGSGDFYLLDDSLYDTRLRYLDVSALVTLRNTNNILPSTLEVNYV